MKELLFNLLKFETTAENSKELSEIVDYIDEFFNKHKVYKSRFVRNNKPSIVITSKFTKSPKIMLNGHLDVVHADYEKAFEPYEKDGKIYGRGAADMKGVVSAMIVAFIEAIQEDKDIDIGIMLTTDEEIGGKDGVEYLLKEEGYTAEVAFVPDQGNGWKVSTDEKGVLWYKIESNGPGAHASRPWEAFNPLNACWKTYRDIRNEFRRKWGKLGENDGWQPTINMGSLKGGDSYNKVPVYAEMKLDIRVPAEVDENEIKKIIEKCCNDNQVKFENTLDAKASHTDKDNKFLQSWEREVINLRIEPPQYIKAHGGSDGRYFCEQGIPTLMTTPTMAIVHSDHEWIDWNDLVLFKDVLKNWIVESNKI